MILYSLVCGCVWVQADIGEVHKALRGELFKCLHESNSLQGNYRYQRLCLKPLYFCLRFLKPHGRRYTEINMRLNQLCGGLNTGEHFQPQAQKTPPDNEEHFQLHPQEPPPGTGNRFQPSHQEKPPRTREHLEPRPREPPPRRHLAPNTWVISSPGKLGIYLVIHLFQLPVNDEIKHCGRASVNIIIYGVARAGYRLCGYRVPWNISSTSSSAVITLYKREETQKGCYFIMSFEAFDIYSATAETVQQSFQGISRDHKDREKIISLPNTYMVRPMDPSCLSRTEKSLHIFTNVYKYIVVEYFSTLIIQIHDGPGPLSPLVTNISNISQHYITVSLSSFQGYIKFCAIISYNQTTLTKEPKVSWRSADIELGKYSKDCIHYTNIATVFTSTSGYCQPQKFNGYFRIHQLRFIGFDTLFTYPSPEEKEFCQYGGLFIVFYPRKNTDFWHGSRHIKLPRSYYRLCSNVTTENTFPYISMAGGSNILIVFQTFKGYSSGFVDISIPIDKECYGENVLFTSDEEHIGISGVCNEREQSSLSWNDNMESVQQKTTGTYCTDIWLSHNIISLGAGRKLFPNCSFDLSAGFNAHQKLGLLGSVRLAVSSSIIYPSLSYMDHKDTEYFNMDMLVNTLEDFPVSSDTVETHTSVNLLNETEYLFNFISKIYLTVRHRAKDAPIFAVRMRILTDLACGSALYDNFSGIYPVHKVSSDTSTVMLSQYFPHNALLYILLNKTGHIHGPCRILFDSRSCSQAQSQTLQIYFRPEYGNFLKKVRMHKIDVSLKAVRCLTDCYLNIGIWEQLETETARTGSCYHEWKNIYRLTWYAVADWGYLLNISSTCDQLSTCSSCTYDIFVSISVFQSTWKINEQLFPLYLPTVDNKGYLEQLADCMNPPQLSCFVYEALTGHNSFGVFFEETTYTGFSLSDLEYLNWYEAQEFCSRRNSHLVTLTPMLSHKLKQIFISKFGLSCNWESLHVFAGLHRGGSVGINFYF